MEISELAHVPNAAPSRNHDDRIPTTESLPVLVEYRVTSAPCPDRADVITYGILACQVDSEGTHTVAALPDLSADRRFVEGLVCEFNSFALSPLHLTDAVLDRLP